MANLPPLLTAADERRLARMMEQGRAAQDRISQGRARSGDRALVDRGLGARRRFFEANVRLVVSIASKMRAPGHVDRDDMIQDGMVGLDRAVEKFDWRRGFKFSTYAGWWIRQAVQRGMESTAASIHIPANRANELKIALAEVDGEFTRLPPKLAAVAAAAAVDSLDRPVRDGDGVVADALADTTVDPEAMLVAAVERLAVGRLLDHLEPSTRLAVTLRFGLDGNEKATYRVIAARLGVGTEAARRRVVKALEDLQEPAERLVAA